MNKFTFMFTLILLFIISGLVYLSSYGSIAAMVTLAIVGTAVLISIGAMIALLSSKATAANSQRAFAENARENLDIIQGTQQALNSQNTQLLKLVQLFMAGRMSKDVFMAEYLKQVGPGAQQQGKLPPANGLIVEDDAIFSDLES